METAVKRIGAVVVAELRACGYMESTIGQYEKTIRALTKFIDGHGGAYTPALGAAFASMTVSPRTGRFSATPGNVFFDRAACGWHAQQRRVSRAAGLGRD